MVGVLLRLLLCLFFFALSAPLCCQGALGGGEGGAGGGSGGVIEGALFVEGSSVIGTTDDHFVCATLDWWPSDTCGSGTCMWANVSILNLNLSSTMLLSAVKAFSPLKLRLGGSLQDKVIYEVGDPNQPCTPFVRNVSEMFNYSQGCLPVSRWDQLNGFSKESGAVVVFGLNALNGRVPLADGSVGGPWNYTNAAALISYTVSKGYTIYGWELGNELSGKGIRARIDVDQYASDVISLKSIVDKLYKGRPTKALVVAPGGNFEEVWYSEFLNKTKPNSLDVLTHHMYILGPGTDEHLIDKILDPYILDRAVGTFSDLQMVVKNAGTSNPVWVGEAGGAYHGGRNLVTNAFVSSFWYLDQLGMSSSYDTKTYCRQSLIGANYGLLNTTTYEPNPDYYSALLFHRLMGRNALPANFMGTKKLRTYAHCARESLGITVLLINLDGNNTVQVAVNAASSVSNNSKHSLHKIIGFTRHEYHLTAKDGDLQSQTMLLNGNILAVDSGLNIPKLEPITVNSSEPITVSPFSIVFAHIPSFNAPACAT